MKLTKMPYDTDAMFRSPHLQKVSKDLVAQLSKNNSNPEKIATNDNNNDSFKFKKMSTRQRKLRKVLYIVLIHGSDLENMRLDHVFKIVLPHVGLNVLLILYMSAGALILMFIEKNHELYKRHEKLTNVTKIYRSIFTLTNQYCESKSTSDSYSIVNVSLTSDRELAQKQMFRENLELLLIDLSKVHEFDDRFADEDQLWTNDETQIRSRWTFQAALLYVLTVLCTTGYDHISPATDAGRIFAVCFGLLGIPLMFIAAADIGKFLSEMVSKAYSKILTLGRYAKQKLAKLAQMRRRWRNEDSNSGSVPLSETPITCPSKKMSLMSENDSLFNVPPAASETRLELPIISYFGLVLDFVFTDWVKGASDKIHTRQITYTTQLNYSFGPKSCQVIENQEKRTSQNQLTIVGECRNVGIPSGDIFDVGLTYCITRISSHTCRLRGFGGLIFRKNCWGFFKNLLEKTAFSAVEQHFIDLGNHLRNECSSINQGKHTSIELFHSCTSLYDALIRTKKHLNRKPKQNGRRRDSKRHDRSENRDFQYMFVFLTVILILLVCLNVLLYVNLWFQYTDTGSLDGTIRSLWTNSKQIDFKQKLFSLIKQLNRAVSRVEGLLTELKFKLGR
uniref:VASt domain-containing protein n=1 Tax=Romanomermis culicivorax TaxID=13658 RepID=A0A915KBI1_ROMCU